MACREQFNAEQHSVRVLKVGERVRHILSSCSPGRKFMTKR